jgi:hypothetical protein
MRRGLVWRGACRQGGEDGAEQPAVFALPGKDEVFRDDSGAIRAAGGQIQPVSLNAGGGAGAEAAEAPFSEDQKASGRAGCQPGGVRPAPIRSCCTPVEGR